MPMRRAGLALALTSLLLAGCAGRQAPTSSVSPAGAEPSPSSVPAATPSPATDPPATDAPFGPPPPAVLVAGSIRQDGEVGSYAWPGGAESAPWLPAGALVPVTLTDRAPLTIEPAPGVAIARWTARAARAADTSGDQVVPLGEGAGAPSFDPPPAGAWVLAVHTVFETGGEATWYWSVEVP